MAYNSGFPMTYQQFYQPQYQQPYNSFQSGNNQMQQQAAQQMMTPPTIHAEIVQISGRDDAVNFPVGAGQATVVVKWMVWVASGLASVVPQSVITYTS